MTFIQITAYRLKCHGLLKKKVDAPKMKFEYIRGKKVNCFIIYDICDDI